MVIGYYGIFSRDKENPKLINVIIPDLPSSTTFGDSREDAMIMAIDCLYTVTNDYLVSDLPKASTKEELEKKINEKEYVEFIGSETYVDFISYETSEYLKDKSGNRVGSLDEDGKVVGK